MLKLQPKDTFWAPVSISVPGAPKPVTIQIEFKYKDQDELQSFFETVEGKKHVEYMGELVNGWKGVDTDFSDEALVKLLTNFPLSGRAILDVFANEMYQDKAKLKNSLT